MTVNQNLILLLLTNNSENPRYPVIYMSSHDVDIYASEILSRFYLPKSVISVVPYNYSSPNSRTLDIKAFERMISDDIACGKLPLLAITTVGECHLHVNLNTLGIFRYLFRYLFRYIFI